MPRFTLPFKIISNYYTGVNTSIYKIEQLTTYSETSSIQVIRWVYSSIGTNLSVILHKQTVAYFTIELKQISIN